MAGATVARGIKFTLVIVDVIVFLSGLIMLIAGSVVQSQIKSEKLMHTIGGFSTQAGSIICILFGIAILLFATLGLFAAIKDHHRFLFVYSFFMLIIFIIQFITGVIGLSVKNSSKFNSYVEEVFGNELKLNSSEVDERDFYQEKFKCCGWNGVDDYRLPNSTLDAPKSCCKDPNDCLDLTNKTNLNAEPCSLKLTDAARAVIEVSCAILVTFSIFNFLSIVLSFLLSRQIRNGYQYS